MKKDLSRAVTIDAKNKVQDIVSQPSLAAGTLPTLKQTPEFSGSLQRTANEAQHFDTAFMISEIRRLKEVRNAVILAHNYQIPAIQDIADFVGDSLGLSQQAAKTEAKTIVFCGVHFMAETAAILCPQKRVLIPDLEAGCSLAASIDLAQLKAWKAQQPGAVVVSYVNTTAEIKAESDYCCTSGNALKVVQSIPADQEILFLPDVFLGSWVKKMTGRENMHIWMGECHVHASVHPEVVDQKLKEFPEAELLIHPECGCLTPFLDRVASTSQAGQLTVASTEGMMKRAAESSATQFVVATEEGILHRLKKENPEKEFLPITNEMTCQFMKMITLEKLYLCLRDDVFHVTVDKDIADKALRAIERMVSIY
jgi:quinolinate synthase